MKRPRLSKIVYIRVTRQMKEGILDAICKTNKDERDLVTMFIQDGLDKLNKAEQIVDAKKAIKKVAKKIGRSTKKVGTAAKKATKATKKLSKAGSHESLDL